MVCCNTGAAQPTAPYAPTSGSFIVQTSATGQDGNWLSSSAHIPTAATTYSALYDAGWADAGVPACLELDSSPANYTRALVTNIAAQTMDGGNCYDLQDSGVYIVDAGPICYSSFFYGSICDGGILDGGPLTVDAGYFCDAGTYSSISVPLVCIDYYSVSAH
jgi:hypothetical protein